MKCFVMILTFTCACIFSQAQVNVITTIAGQDTGGFCGDGGPAINGALYSPDGICIDKWGNLYIADGANYRIRKITLSTGIITTVAGTGAWGYNGDSIQATEAELFIPDAVYADTTGNIYIADWSNHRIRKIIVATGIITTIAGTGSPGNTGDGGQATNAKITSPAGLYIDKQQNIYIADADNNNIRKVTPGGIISTIAGNGTLGYSGDGGPATDATFSSPTKAILDNYGNIIIADNYNHAIRKVDAATGIITTIAGNGTPGYSGNGGPAIHALLNNPYGVYIDQQNNIFFAEYGNGVIRKIDGSTAVITTVAGDGTWGFSGDGGPATDAELIPEDLTFDSYGTMYIADYQNNRIREVYNPKLSVSNTQMNHAAIQIYPNPAQDELTIEYQLANNEDATLQITDVTGRMIATKNLSGQKQKEVLDISGFAQGLYLYKVTRDNLLISTGKIVKE